MAHDLHSLPLFHRIAGEKIVVVGTGNAAQAKRRLVERAGGIACTETEAHHARLALVALEDDKAAAATALRLRQRGLLVNVADRPELCDFTLPSVLERGPVLVAVGTGGASAGLAKQLRLRLERYLPQSLGPLARTLQAARARLRAKYPHPGHRRQVLDQALGEGGPLDPWQSDPLARFDAWLNDDASPAGDCVCDILLSSIDPDDLTIKQARLLGQADTIYYERGVPSAILARGRADAVRIALPADIAGHGGLALVLRLGPHK